MMAQWRAAAHLFEKFLDGGGGLHGVGRGREADGQLHRRVGPEHVTGGLDGGETVGAGHSQLGPPRVVQQQLYDIVCGHEEKRRYTTTDMPRQGASGTSSISRSRRTGGFGVDGRGTLDQGQVEVDPLVQERTHFLLASHHQPPPAAATIRRRGSKPTCTTGEW